MPTCLSLTFASPPTSQTLRPEFDENSSSSGELYSPRIGRLERRHDNLGVRNARPEILSVTLIVNWSGSMV